MHVKTIELTNVKRGFLIISLNFLKGSENEMQDLLQNFEEGLYSDVEDPFDRTFITHVYDSEDNLKMLIEGIKENNKSVPLILLGSSYKSCEMFCRLWMKHFDFSGAILL